MASCEFVILSNKIAHDHVVCHCCANCRACSERTSTDFRHQLPAHHRVGGVFRIDFHGNFANRIIALVSETQSCHRETVPASRASTVSAHHAKLLLRDETGIVSVSSQEPLEARIEQIRSISSALPAQSPLLNLVKSLALGS